MNWIRLIIIVTIPIFITILGLEFGARLILDSGDKRSRDYSDYLPKELDKSLPFIADKNGQKCIELNLGFNWNQWWGFVNRDLDLECAKRHFLDDTFNVVFMGGSAMFNREAPNFHTTIDYLAINDLKKVRSINLAESGARHMNMSVRFQREVTKLKPDLVIFLMVIMSSILFHMEVVPKMILLDSIWKKSNVKTIPSLYRQSYRTQFLS